MTEARARIETKSAARQAFAHYLRTGRRLPDSALESNRLKRGSKFNQNHDPSNGQFTFGPGGSASLGRGGGSNIRPGAARPQSAGSVPPPARSRPNGLSRHAEPVRLTAAVPYRRADGKTYMDPRSGEPMMKPADVNLADTVRFGEQFNSPTYRYAVAGLMFGRGRPMDYQRTRSSLRDANGDVLIDRRYIAFGNYNFGVYAAASGMSLDEALKGASFVYNMTTNRARGFNNSGPHHGNPRNSSFIVSGYRDYKAGRMGN